MSPRTVFSPYVQIFGDVPGGVARLARDVGPTVLCAATHGRSRSASAHSSGTGQTATQYSHPRPKHLPGSMTASSFGSRFRTLVACGWGTGSLPGPSSGHSAATRGCSMRPPSRLTRSLRM